MASKPQDTFDASEVVSISRGELQAMMDEAAERATARMLAANGGVQTPGMELAFSNMATAIAEMTQQQSGRPAPVPPHVMASRRKAQEELDAVLLDINKQIRKAQFEGRPVGEIAPHWRVVNKFFVSIVDNDGKPFAQMIEPFQKVKRRGDPPQPRTIHWAGAPSLALRPINAIAHKIYDLHRAAIGTASKFESVSGFARADGLDNRTYVAMVDTAGNVRTVQTDSVSLNQHSVAVDPGPEPSGSDYGEGNDPRAAETHVLGTLHPATRRNQAGHMRAPAGGPLIEGA